MVEHSKRKKFHDKDKYYKLAKEQGFRSRAAFKLSQINRKFPMLDNAKVVLDLCAAPGGWTQVASRMMPKSGSIIVAVDILPIRSLGPNVITLIGDITTDKCKSEIRQNLQNAPVDVVLHDGAPNIGASYDKDAYEQNEIALHALKCATQHLKPKGDFVTKLYRSRDYASYVWVAKHFFHSVTPVKPNASRAQSAEIFLVCQGYKKPDKIDPRILDPKHVFEQIEGDSTGGQLQSGKQFNVFHKNWNTQKRHRDGYDTTKMDFTMRNITPVTEFVECNSNNNTAETNTKKLLGPIELLSVSTGMKFQCHMCDIASDKRKDKGATSYGCNCQFYRDHPATTAEIKACLSDLKVLNKSDFKGLLLWRAKVLDAWKEEQKKRQTEREENNDTDQGEEDGANKDTADAPGAGSDEDEARIQDEIAELRQRRLRERKKLKKKERAAAAKRRRRAALGMDLNAVDVPDHDKIFSLATITNKGDLEAAREVNLDKVTHESVFGPTESDEEAAMNDDGSVQSQGEKDDIDEETGYSFRLDRELDAAYDRYLKTTKDGMAKSGTKMAKRSKKLRRQKAAEQAAEDEELMLNSAHGLDSETKEYAKMLSGGHEDDDDDDDDDKEGGLERKGKDDMNDDGFDDEPMTPKEHAAKQRKLKKDKKEKDDKDEGNPLIHKLVEPTSVKTARWFSNPLFESLGTTAQLAAMGSDGKKQSATEQVDTMDSDDDATDDDDDNTEQEDADVDADDEQDEAESEAEKPAKKKRKKGLDAEEVLASMPKTDKEIRHERRLKAIAREERRQARKAKLMGDLEGDFALVPAARDSDDEEEQADKLDGLSESKKQKIKEARALIKAGMGKQSNETDSGGFEVVSAAESSNMKGPLSVKDTRKYDSENEDYDSDDYARTLALGTMMLRQSKAKALVDASYNRYAWNDPEELPDWFVDDENKNYRPQLPIPQALLEKIKAKQLALSIRPIAKVAEARARKSKRAKLKLAAAKKKAEAVANSSEMSEAMKLKAISKAMRGQDSKAPSKTYVIAKKGRQTKGAKGVKIVDKRMKNDKRSMDRATKKRSKGKQGGLTGSKKRRHHS